MANAPTPSYGGPRHSTVLSCERGETPLANQGAYGAGASHAALRTNPAMMVVSCNSRTEAFRRLVFPAPRVSGPLNLPRRHQTRTSPLNEPARRVAAASQKKKSKNKPLSTGGGASRTQSTRWPLAPAGPERGSDPRWLPPMWLKRVWI